MKLPLFLNGVDGLALGARRRERHFERLKVYFKKNLGALRVTLSLRVCVLNTLRDGGTVALK